MSEESPLHKKIPVIEPGGLIGILGGGQLGRMTAMAARTMGYRVRVMDPEAKCPACFVADQTIVATAPRPVIIFASMTDPRAGAVGSALRSSRSAQMR